MDRIYRMNMILQILVIQLILSTYSSFLLRASTPPRENPLNPINPVDLLFSSSSPSSSSSSSS